MKKAALIILSCLLLVPGIAAAGEMGMPRITHELWDIPFEVSIDDFAQVVRENTGVVVEPHRSDRDISMTFFDSIPSQSPRFYGIPFEMVGLFEEYEQRGGKTQDVLESIALRLNDEVFDHGQEALSTEQRYELLRDAFDTFQEANILIEDPYGSPTGGFISRYDGDGVPAKYYDYPQLEGDALFDLLWTMIQDEGTFRLLLSYDNITCSLSIDTLIVQPMHVSVYITFNNFHKVDDSFYTFTTEDGPLPETEINLTF